MVKRDAVADQPVRRKLRLRAFGLHRALDQVEALIQPVGAVFDIVVAVVGRRQHGIARFDDVAAAHLERRDAELPCQLVDRGFHRDQGLRQAVAAECACRHSVGVDGDPVDLLVGTIIDRKAFADGVKQHRAGMIAVGAGVGEHVELQRRQLAVLVGAGLDRDAHGMAGRGRDELLLARQLEFDRAAGLQRGERQDVLDEHLLLAAEPAADALAEHPNLVGRKIKQLDSVRRVRNGTCVELRTLSTPAVSTQASPPWVSSAACWTRWVVKVPS